MERRNSAPAITSASLGTGSAFFAASLEVFEWKLLSAADFGTARHEAV
jgi:hypothetical protein